MMEWLFLLFFLSKEYIRFQIKKSFKEIKITLFWKMHGRKKCYAATGIILGTVIYVVLGDIDLFCCLGLWKMLNFSSRLGALFFFHTTTKLAITAIRSSAASQPLICWAVSCPFLLSELRWLTFWIKNNLLCQFDCTLLCYTWVPSSLLSVTELFSYCRDSFWIHLN